MVMTVAQWSRREKERKRETIGKDEEEDKERSEWEMGEGEGVSRLYLSRNFTDRISATRLKSKCTILFLHLTMNILSVS